MANYSNTNEPIYNLSTRLFGLPHQFPPIVDPRVSDISRTIGSSYAEKIVADGAVCTIIPGKPKYLPTQKGSARQTTTSGLLLALNSGFKNTSSISNFINSGGRGDYFKLYDFEKCYHEYMSYVNLLCRSGAALLGLDQIYNLPGGNTSFMKYNWANWKWNNRAKGSNVGSYIYNLKSLNSRTSGGISTSDEGATTESLDSIFNNTEYVQFYIDPESSASDSLSNSQTESQIKSLFDSNSGMLKELAFMMDSGMVGDKAADFSNFVTDSVSSLGAFTEETLNGTPFSALGRIINLGGNVLKGENIIIPDIYQTSSYSKNYDITCHLRSPYGTKLSYYLNIFVPMMHLMALAMPKATSANSFHSPFIIKAFVEGAWSCNLGLVQSITINRVGESRSVDGLPMEVDVSLSIADLYSDLSMNNNADIINFVNNTSLVDYLATNCGLSLAQPNYESKVNLALNTAANIPSNIGSAGNQILEKLHSSFGSMINPYW
jgi:hypothetical protein